MPNKNAVGSQSTIEDEIHALKKQIADYRSTLNQEGIWLFLATLGCWSVSQADLQGFAFLVVLFLFGQRMSQRLNGKTPFNRLFNKVEIRIFELTPVGDARKARQFDLDTIRKQELSTLTSLRSISAYLLSWTFYGASVLYTIFLS